ncbi:hypothetical protein ACH4U6_06700 [Streptomyces netropsis]|uniref:hypothetical protein n=1 Tax=Streptomyces netropsis TaxID=55404 RepID=UPI0037B78134
MTAWTWDYDPSAEYVTSGLPPGVLAEVERLATELAALGRDAAKVGLPDHKEGGLRELDILGGYGLVGFLVVARDSCVYVVNVTWTG